MRQTDLQRQRQEGRRQTYPKTERGRTETNTYPKTERMWKRHRNRRTERKTDRQTDRDRETKTQREVEFSKVILSKTTITNLTSGTQEQEKRNHAFPCCDLSNQPVMTAAPFV